MVVKPFYSQEKKAYRHTMTLEGRHDTKNASDDLSIDNLIFIDRVMESGCKNPVEYINKRFQPIIDEYNAKQKRADRIITESYEEYWMKNKNLNTKLVKPTSKNQLFYETACGIGAHESLGHLYYDTARQLIKEKKKPEDKQDKLLIRQLEKKKADYISFFKEMAEKTLEDIQKTFPHLEIMYASLHLDEEDGTPHLQFAYLPIGEGYKKGLPTQSNLAKALENDGVERIPGATKEEYQWKRFFKACKEIIGEAAIEASKAHPDLFPDGLEIDYTEGEGEHQTKEQWLAEKAKADKEISAYKTEEKAKADKEISAYKTDEKARVDNQLSDAKESLEKAVSEASEKHDEVQSIMQSIITLKAQKERTEKHIADAEKRLDDAIDKDADWAQFFIDTGKDISIIDEHREWAKKRRYSQITEPSRDDIRRYVDELKNDYDDYE